MKLLVREIKKTYFRDPKIVWGAHASDVYSYERDNEEVLYVVDAAGSTTSVTISNFIKKNTKYKVSIRLFDNGSSGATRIRLSTPAGGALKSTTYLPNFNTLANNTNTFYYLSGDDIDLKLMFIKTGIETIDCNLDSIILEEIQASELSLQDTDKGIVLNRSIKEIRDPDKYKVGYSNSFNILMDNNTSEYLKFKNLNPDSEIIYSAIISDDSFDMKGSLVFKKNQDNYLGADVIQAQFFEMGAEFFDSIKDKWIHSLSTESSYLDYNRMVSKMKTPQVAKDTDETFWFGTIDNGQINNTAALTTGWSRGFNENNFNGIPGYSHKLNLGMCDIYPSVYVRKIWDLIHEQAGYAYEGDIFDTDNWNGLLVNDLSKFKIDKETQENFKSRGEIIQNATLGVLPGFASFASYNEWLTLDTHEGECTYYGYEPSTYTTMKSKINIKVEIDLETDPNFETFDDNQHPGAFLHIMGEVHLIFIPVQTGSIDGEVFDINEGNYIVHNIGNFDLQNFNKGDTKYVLDTNVDIDYNQFIGNVKYRAKVMVIPSYYNQTVDAGIIYLHQICDVNIEGSMEFDSHDRISTGNQFYFSNVVPKMKQIDFIKNIASLFNLRFEFDVEKKLITWYTFDEYYMKYSDIKNFNNIIQKDKLVKKLGAEFQSNNNIFSYKLTKGNVIEQYNDIYEHQFGSYTKRIPGELKKKETKFENGFGIQPFEYVIDGYLPLINNNNKVDIIYSSAIPRNNNVIPFLSYSNIIPLNSDIIFRKEFLVKIDMLTIPTSSPILSHKPLGNNSEVYTLEYYQAENNSTIYKEPTQNHYDLYLQNDFGTKLNTNAFILDCNVKLDNYDFSQLKLNDIIEYEENLFMIDKITGFNENKLTKLTLLKINFNPNYTGTVLEPFAYIHPDSYHEGFGYVFTTNAIYISGVDSFDVTYDGLTDDLIIHNNGFDNKYQISLDGVIWNNFPSGADFTLRTAATLVNGETFTIYYRLATALSYGLNLAYTSWSLTSGYTTNGIIETVSLRTRLRRMPIGNIGSETINPINVISGETSNKTNTKNRIIS